MTCGGFIDPFVDTSSIITSVTQYRYLFFFDIIFLVYIYNLDLFPMLTTHTT